MSPATVHKLADRIRTLPLDAKIDAIAHDVDGLEVLARQNAEAQRATGDAVEAIAESLATGLGTQREHGNALADLAGVAIGTEMAVSALAAAVGTLPDPKALAHASSTDLSPEAIQNAALGTGLHRRVSDLQVKLGGLDRKLAVAGFATAAGATVLPAIFAALPGTAQLASGVVLALVAALGGVWASKKKAAPQLPPKEG